MVSVTLDGANNQDLPAKVHIADDVYEAVIKDISDPFITPNKFEGEDKEKIVVSFEIKEGEKEYTLPMFVTTTVSKGEGNYSNSKLFDVLDKKGLIEDFKSTWEKISVMDKEVHEEKFTDYLKDNLIGAKCKVLTKTVNKDKADKRYSIVKEITRYIE
jgi:hypothetical protein